MHFSFHPPTGRVCDVCQNTNGDLRPIIDTQRGKASAAENFPFHNWYSFVLGYTPEFPNYIINRERISEKQLVVDPFLGSGTTTVCCKSLGIPSAGVEANDFFAFAAGVKTNWKIDPRVVRRLQARVMKELTTEFGKYEWPLEAGSLRCRFTTKHGQLDPVAFANHNRPELLLERYISAVPLAGLLIVKDVLSRISWPSRKTRDFFSLAFSASVLPASNVRYGPGFGVVPARNNVNVLGIFEERLERMIADLESVAGSPVQDVRSSVILGDARHLASYFEPNSVDIMITSPPYPGDHEYTKYSKLELILDDLAGSLSDFKTIKQRMLRGSTTNIYKDDSDGDLVRDIESINAVTLEIDRRLREDGATSGFEKLYTKLIWEYFGGMYRVFEDSWKVLKPGAKFSLLVSDSHAFKMVHIKTAELLEEVAMKAGFVNCRIDLWQYKISTSHKYKLLENILTIEKPSVCGK